MSGKLVLVAEPDPFDLRTLTEACEAQGHQVLSAADGDQALGVLARDPPDLAILDARLPGIDGLEVIRVIRSDGKLGDVPVLVVVDEDDDATQSRALDLGADDWVRRPFRVFEVQTRIRRVLRRRPVSGTPSAEPELFDAVTRAGTRAQLVLTLDYEFTRCARFGHPLSCLVAEIRGLPQAAASAEAADRALATAAATARASIRTIDHLFRADAGRLALVLPETDAAGAAAVAARLREADAAGELFGPAGRALALRLALGSASHPTPGVDGGVSLYRAAARALAAS